MFSVEKHVVYLILLELSNVSVHPRPDKRTLILEICKKTTHLFGPSRKGQVANRKYLCANSSVQEDKMKRWDVMVDITA